MNSIGLKKSCVLWEHVVISSQRERFRALSGNETLPFSLQNLVQFYLSVLLFLPNAGID